MPNKRTIKEQIVFNNQMKKIIESLKDIDQAHFTALYKHKKEQFEKFDYFFDGFFQTASLLGAEHPSLKPLSNTVGIIAVTSDEVFMGKLNSMICKICMGIVESEKKQAEFIVVGKKGAIRLRGSNQQVTIFPAIKEGQRYELAVKISDYVMKQSQDMRIGALYLVYTCAKSFTQQKTEIVKLLPATELFKEREKMFVEKWQPLCVESSLSGIVEYLVETWIVYKLFDAFFNAKLAEYAVRAVQMEQGLQYVVEEQKRLNMSFNKVRREEIDTGTRETFSAMMGSMR